MKHAGLLAHSPDGAALCFLEFCHKGAQQQSDQIHPTITLDYIALGHTFADWEAGELTTIREVLGESISNLKRAGAEFFFCADNTAHIALEAEGQRFDLPGLNIAEIVAAEAAEVGIKKIGILGTKYTMNGPVYERAMTARGIECITPTASEQVEINRIIFDGLIHGRFLAQSQNQYYDTIDRLVERGCDGIAMVCTEIPLLLSQSEVEVPLIDSTRLLARAALEVAKGEAPMPTWRGGTAF